MSIDPFGPPLEPLLKQTIRDLDDGDGVPVSEALEAAVRDTKYAEIDAEDALEKMVQTGEVYHSTEDVVRVVS